MPTNVVNSSPLTTAQPPTRKRKQPESPPPTSSKRRCPGKENTQNSLSVNSNVIFAVPTNRVEYPINHITQSKLQQHSMLIPKAIWESYGQAIIGQLRLLYSDTLHSPDWKQINENLVEQYGHQKIDTLDLKEKLTVFFDSVLEKDNYYHLISVLTDMIVSSFNSDKFKETVKANLSALKESVDSEELVLIKNKGLSYCGLLNHILLDIKKLPNDFKKLQKINDLFKNQTLQALIIIRPIFKNLHKDAISLQKILPPSPHEIMTIENFYSLLEKDKVTNNIILLAIKMQKYCAQKELKTETAGYVFFKYISGIFRNVTCNGYRSTDEKTLSQSDIELLNTKVYTTIKFNIYTSYIDDTAKLEGMQAKSDDAESTNNSATITNFSK